MVFQVPSYLIVAGLVFTTLTVPFLRSEFGEEWECEACASVAFWFCGVAFEDIKAVVLEFATFSVP